MFDRFLEKFLLITKSNLMHLKFRVDNIYDAKTVEINI